MNNGSNKQNMIMVVLLVFIKIKEKE